MSNMRTVELVNQIQDELGIMAFTWFKYDLGLVLPAKSLEDILSAIIKLKERV
jgi:hypothetical protein